MADFTLIKANPTQGEITSSLTGSTGDGAGLHLEAGGTITLTNAAAAEFGTSDFSLEFVLNRTANNTNNNVIYESHSSGNNRITLKALTGGDLVATFTNSSGVNADYNTGYDIDVDLNTVTHYALTFDRSGDLTVYKNGNSVSTISIAASSAVNIGDSNTNTGRIGYVTTYGVIGTFYRFRAFNTLADAKLLLRRADVPQTLTANLLFDLDLAFANPTQSLTVQDRKGNTDGTASSSTLVTQVQPVVQLNSTSARIGTTAATPADGELMVSGNVSISDDQYYQWGGTNARIVGSHAGDYVKILTGNSAKLTIDSSGLLTAKNAISLDTNTTPDTSGGEAFVYKHASNGTTLSGYNASIETGSAGSRVSRLTISSTGAVSLGPGTAAVTTLKPSLLVTDTSVGGSVTVRGKSPILAFDVTDSGTGTILTDGGGLNVKDGNLDGHGSTLLAIDKTSGLATFSGGIALQTSPSNDSATANEAYTLDKYETGTWTCTLNGASSVGNTTGHYTRIGNICHFTFYSGSLTSTAVDATFSGLPFTASAGYYSVFSAAHNTICPNADSGFVAINTDTGKFTASNSTAVATYTAATGRYVMITGTYTVA